METSSPDGSAEQSSEVSSPLYDAWMTGWSYEACRFLYFGRKDPQALQKGEKAVLVSWLSTYRNLVEGWNAVDDDTSRDLEQMMREVVPRRPVRRGEGNAEPVKLDYFDSDFEEIKGAIRADVPYAYYTVLFASYASRLRFPREGDPTPTMIDDMRVSLSNMKGVLPAGAYDVVDDDLSEMKKTAKKGPAALADPEPAPTGQRRGGSTGHDEALKHKIQVWSDLILGTITVIDALNMNGRALLYLSIVGVGLGVFVLVGGVIVGVFEFTQILPGFSLSSVSLSTGSSVISTIQNAAPSLTAVGLSLSLLATKAWNGMKAFELWAAVQLVRYPQLRRRSVRHDGEV